MKLVLDPAGGDVSPQSESGQFTAGLHKKRSGVMKHAETHAHTHTHMTWISVDWTWLLMLEDVSAENFN